MAPNLLFYQLLLVSLVLICLLIHVGWPDGPRVAPQMPRKPNTPRRQRSTEPKPFTGFIYNRSARPVSREPKTPQGAGRATSPDDLHPRTPGTVDTHAHFCPDPDCAYYGRLGRGNLRANGHPGSQSWRQLQCVSCQGYFYETHGTMFHGKRASVDLVVRVIACLAEGLGIRGTARVFEIDPNTVLQWLVQAADSFRPFLESWGIKPIEEAERIPGAVVRRRTDRNDRPFSV